MVSVSRERAEETDARLRRVIAAAEMVELEGVWTFHETPIERPPALTASALAVVRDESSWSVLAPADDPDAGHGTSAERFGLVSFHFPEGLDNSGFVGWLATELKRELGTGVFVVCGSNAARGGVYDYWGYPESMTDEVRGVLRRLRGGAD